MFMFQFSPVHSNLVVNANSKNSFLAPLSKSSSLVFKYFTTLFAFEFFVYGLDIFIASILYPL